MPPVSSWTDARVQTLTRLWREGLSASQIARALAGGVSRNAVIGKLHRLGLAARPGPGVSRRPRLQRPVRAKRSRKPQLPPQLPPRVPCLVGGGWPSPEGGCADILSVRRGQCRWPLGDPREAGFTLCGAPAVRGAYCEAHGGVAYRPRGQQPPADHLLKLAGLA